MYIWPDELELLRLNDSGDRVVLRDLFNSTIIMGEKGCGKTSGSAAHLHMALLKTQCPGLIVCPKPDDKKMFLNTQIRPAGRERDVILMEPTKSWNENPVNAINVLDAEQKFFAGGNPAIAVANITAMLMRVCDLIARQSGPGAANEAFWRKYAEKIIKAGLTVQSVNSPSFSLKNLLKFTNELPNSLQETEEQSSYAVAEMKKAREFFGENEPFDFTMNYDFVMREWPLTPANSRGSGALTVQVMLHELLSHPLRQMMFEETTFDLSRVLHGQGILLLDMNVHDYAQGRIAGMILKDLISRACEARHTQEKELTPPCYLLIDEYPEFACDEDERHARMGRSGRLIQIFIAQSTSALKAQFHDKDRAQSLLDLAGCRWAHQNGSFETNEWMSKSIAEVLVEREGWQEGDNWNYSPQNSFGRNRGRNVSMQKDFDCPPRAFTRLLRGGPANNLKTEAIFWRSGETFRWNSKPWLPVVFPQNFRSGRDEVRVTAKAIQRGENHDSIHTECPQERTHSTAKNGWQRLGSLLSRRSSRR